MSASQPLPFLLRSLYHNIKLNVRKRYAGMEINMSDTTNLGEGSIGSLLAKLAVPAVVAQVVNLLYNIVDRIYIGHIPGIGASALTGVGLFTPILMLINAFAMLAGSGGAPRAAIYMGKKDNETAQSPGMKYKHYAPKARVVIVDANRKTYEAFVNKQKGAFALCFDEDEVDIPRVNYGSESDDLSQARELFDALRKLDEMGAETVYARIPHTTGVGMAVYNRLIRAAAFTVIDLNKPFTLGLTGQSGAGKSYICKKLEKHGFNIVDCDDVVKNIYDNDKTLVKSLCDEFGDILTNGKLDRKKLGNIVFNDKSKLEKLNSLVHPAVIGRCESLAKLPCVLDAPQLFEAKAQNKCFKTIAVLASEKTRIERITKRDNITVEEAKKRLSSQFSEDYFKSNCDFVIYNNDEDDIDREIDDILHSLGF